MGGTCSVSMGCILCSVGFKCLWRVVVPAARMTTYDTLSVEVRLALYGILRVYTMFSAVVVAVAVAAL